MIHYFDSDARYTKYIEVFCDDDYYLCFDAECTQYATVEDGMTLLACGALSNYSDGEIVSCLPFSVYWPESGMLDTPDGYEYSLKSEEVE